MKMLLPIVFATVFAFATPSLGVIGNVLDQESPYTGDSFWGMVEPRIWQQEVTAGLPGPLVQIGLYFEEPEAGQDVLVFVNAGAPWQSDPHDFQTALTNVVDGWTSIDTSSAGLVFNAGDRFVIGIEPLTPGELWIGGSIPGAYDRGGLWYGGIMVTYSSDFAFQTYVPEPATFLLVGLGGLALVRKPRG